MELYFTRHGKTEWNEAGRLQGRSGDSPLLPSSYLEIEKLGDYLSKVPFERIYCSPSLRARKTAQGIYAKLETPCEIVFKEGLREFGLGELEGVCIKDANEKYPKQMEAFRHDLSNYDPYPYKGETITSVLDRVTQVVVTSTLENKGPILFVSHGAALTAAIQHLIGKPLSELRAMGGLKNNTVTILETEDKELPFTLKVWNEDSFLNEEK
ncbi:MAG: histidine phosphatase family protein [Lactobacillales bacterium]|jgi:probable phosphoglycerate mutase|nr:histidine phosphatase family protein [Lactobacillales bacterium]